MLQLRRLSFLAALPLAALLALPLYAQNPQDSQQQPSLGDLARQMRKDKEKNNTQPKTVITDDNMPSNKGGLSVLGGSQGSADGNAIARGMDKLDEVEATINKLDRMDRATLAKTVLLDHDVDFPGRADWEQRLYAAKERNVSRGRELLGQMRQVLGEVQVLKSAQGGQGKVSPDDPRAKQLLTKIQEIVQEGIRADQEYQAVVVEGWNRAKQAKP